MALVEIPLQPEAQSFSVELGGKPYRMRLVYSDLDEGGWLMDLSDGNGRQMACGIPLLPGQDLLEPFAYLGIGGTLYLDCTTEPEGVPTLDGLGTRTRMFFGTPQNAEAVRGYGTLP